MKRTLCALLSALFLSTLAIPCSAADTAIPKIRDYPGFADVAEESWCYDAVKLCYESGLMNGTSETTFGPQGPLTAAQLVVLTARLYDLRNGGSGAIPALPDLAQPYLRFLGPEGDLLQAYALADSPARQIGTEEFFISLSAAADDALPETCSLVIGFDGYGETLRLEGIRKSYEHIPGIMNQGLTGTGYQFPSSAATANRLFLGDAELLGMQDAWRFPAAFYLASQGVLNVSGDLLYRLAPEGQARDEELFAQSASRVLFAWLTDLAAGELSVLHETVSVPDVTEDTQDADSILRLYRSGILTGVDASGRFHGDGTLTRAQAAVMLSRVLDPGLRI